MWSYEIRELSIFKTNLNTNFYQYLNSAKGDKSLYY